MTRSSLALAAVVTIPFAAPALAQSDDEARPRTAYELARDLGVSGDDSRPANQRRLNFLGKPLIIGGEIGGTLRWRRGYALARGADDDDAQLAPEMKLEAIWLLSDTLVTFADAKIFADSTIYRQGGGAKTQAGLELSEAWLLKTDLFNTPLAVQVGRQQFQDRREWWWDENLDAIRLHYFGDKVRAFVGAAREIGHKSTLGRADPEDKGLHRLLGNLKWDFADRQQVEFFALHQSDRSRRTLLGEIVDRDRRDEADGKLDWIGLRARGRVKLKFPGKFYYWADVARVSGTERLVDFDRLDNKRDIAEGITRRRIRGWAFDVGSSFELPFKSSPYLTLGFARGSGDRNPGSGRDRAFRQTGLHGNNGKFRGLSRFRYYGEVLRPELSNLAVSTVALGIPVGKVSWVETIWHRYRQPVAASRIVGDRLDIDPNGIDRRLGDEFDIVVSHRPTAAWEYELTAGAFRAGPAFGPQEGRWASMVSLKLDYNF